MPLGHLLNSYFPGNASTQLVIIVSSKKQAAGLVPDLTLEGGNLALGFCCHHVCATTVDTNNPA